MHKHSIFFVDDEQSVLDGLKRSMRSFLSKHDIRYFTEPEVALEAAKVHEPCILVSDIRMPNMDGLELVKRFKAEVPQTKTIVLTGTGDLDTAMEAINNAGVFRFYTKPSDPVLLSEGIEEALLTLDNTQEVGTQSLNERVGSAALNHLAIAVIILNSKAEIIYTNNAGASLLADADGLFWAPDKCCRAKNIEETKKLHTYINAAATNNLTVLEEGILTISRQPYRRPYSVAISPLKDDRRHHHAIMFVSDPDKATVPSVDAISKIFSLTQAEARLTHALALGEQLNEAADSCGVTISTARTYLKQVFQKTDTSRQSELIKLVFSASPSF